MKCDNCKHYDGENHCLLDEMIDIFREVATCEAFEQIEVTVCRTCRNLLRDDYCRLHKKSIGNADVAYCGGWLKRAKSTTRDRINQMSNEELAHLFANPCPPGIKKKCKGNDREQCEKCWLEYLNKGVKDD